jgi:hypothetical protein
MFRSVPRGTVSSEDRRRAFFLSPGTVRLKRADRPTPNRRNEPVGIPRFVLPTECGVR